MINDVNLIWIKLRIIVRYTAPHEVKMQESNVNARHIHIRSNIQFNRRDKINDNN